MVEIHGPAPERADLEAIERELRRMFARARSASVEMANLVHPDLDPALYVLLAEIGERAPVRSVELATQRGVTKGVISRQVRSLERLGLLAREPDPADARAFVLAPTTEGRQALRRAQAARRKYTRTLLDGLGATDLAAVADALRKLNGAFE